MPDAVLTIDTPEGQIEIPIAGIDLDAALLSDSRAQMPDLKKIAKALGLSDDASEETILAKVSERAEEQSLDADAVAKALGIESTEQDAIVAKAKQLSDSDSDEEKSLEDRAKDEGKEIVPKSDLDSLKADAAKGAKAADELRQSKFDTAFAKALDELRVDAKDETRERFQKLYDVAADETIAQLEAMPKLANASAKGSGKGAGDVPEGHDEERSELDTEVRAYMVEHTDVDYETALDRVLAKRAVPA